MRMDRHHLLEIILWPNGDGTFRKIINSANRLKELGIYDDYKLTITIPADEHTKMHARNRSDDAKAKMSAAKIGKKLSAEHRAKLSAAKKGNTYAKGNKSNKGKKRSDATKAKISAARKGMKFTAEHRAKLSAAKKGKKLSDDTKEKE